MVESNLNRRLFLRAGTLAMVGLLVPRTARAAESSVASVDVPQLVLTPAPGVELPSTQLEQQQLAAIREEVEALIAADALHYSSRPTYETVYGATKTVIGDFKAVANQPTDGYSMNTGGTVSLSWTGGGSYSIGVSFAAPFGSFSISAAIGKAGVTGVSANIPRGGRWKVYTRSVYSCKPYVVYRVVNGKRTLWSRNLNTLPEWNKFDISVRKV